MLIIASPWRSIILLGNHTGPLASYNGSANVILALTMAPWAMFTTRHRGGRHDDLFGDLSYGVYLLHLPILSALAAGQGNAAERLAKLGAATLVLAAGALSLYFFVDRPNHRRRTAWVATRMTAPEGSPVRLTPAPSAD
jgi:peptidoglycan/LPS O-acetylase OafA/YrhL